jgi:hypothetical protein
MSNESNPPPSDEPNWLRKQIQQLRRTREVIHDPAACAALDELTSEMSKRLRSLSTR